ncbi:MAG: tRNA (adenosine(37)-N6)-threonylcarbamoyltransferase complex transferase subunit TsaD [Sediminibacterium sp. Gen4]|jgi:N6-L-threonylcarbamoyladenine synthase|uniref:tRNA (adenosine(37)-N6)-threonylcarbamoyltransferase complex transferase subunit TsaD n=1 Tax=unclassified Sediminibacterium TaxID=2635961 RepID=UPI0015BD9B06|nr:MULTISPECIES: tRNA (adenosine(37)-N6)-threonylcarbamoyltransferase complex transferase subunit TsaD [unclassified Sediminibacterium]MBW0164130.1 tRNA (adenosine(37)-N6)-threonylcarbamoyltransferase complex transferase subunit TsaD [Sediminibacterium sp.]NWK66707.1 tRNA (adenosine(37)-N6)-threonylcarbamoyltransferase complex transferase subunit TsaD [Sediminibacterium sp. Gen4]
MPELISQPISILAIESSCDETSASVCVDGKILSNFIANQTIHEQYGGVVPELASRAHMQNIVPVVHQALSTANCQLSTINAIAFTQAPGLIGSLLVGAQFAKSMALSLNIPLIGVHHMQAHVLANLIMEPAPSFPFLCLTVSGGHTQIVLARSPLDLEVIGETIDDAAGEAFDKTAKLLGLPYPGGPLIDQYAKTGNPQAFRFAEPQIPELNFSFSGLKTSVLYFLQKQSPDFIQNHLHDLCASVQYTIVNILIKKLKKAVQQTGIRQVCIAGGVSANSGLREALKEAGQKHGWQTFIPAFEYCTDNAAMIAITAYHKYLQREFIDLDASPTARAIY